MRIKATPDVEVKMLLSKHLGVHYETVSPESAEWAKFREQITFNI